FLVVIFVCKQYSNILFFLKALFSGFVVPALWQACGYSAYKEDTNMKTILPALGQKLFQICRRQS
ncbi:MAG: hypothetical protein ACLFRE_09880, partial [Desulfovermiculus sp.]